MSWLVALFAFRSGFILRLDSVLLFLGHSQPFFSGYGLPAVFMFLALRIAANVAREYGMKEIVGYCPCGRFSVSELV